MHIAFLAAIAFVLIAIIGAVASYFDNYFTESVGQWVAHDLRMRTYQHLQRLSLSYYDTHRDRIAAEHDHDDSNHPGIRIFVDTQHLRRPADHRQHAGIDVLAELGFHSDRSGGNAVCSSLSRVSKRQ